MANLSAYDISQMTAAPVWFVRRGVSRRERKVDLTPALSLEEREMTSLACGHPLIPLAPLKGGRGGVREKRGIWGYNFAKNLVFVSY